MAVLKLSFVSLWRCGPTQVMASSLMRFLDHTQQRNTFGKTPLDEWSARRRDLYLTTHNTHKRQTSMPAARFEPIILAGERLQTYALDGAATRTAKTLITLIFSIFHSVFQLQLFHHCLPVVLFPSYSVSAWNVGTNIMSRKAVCTRNGRRYFQSWEFF